MPVTRTDTNDVYRDGKLISSETVEVDVTTEVVEWDLSSKLRGHLEGNKAALAATAATTTAARLRDLEQQVAKLTRQNNALIRIVLRNDLLADNDGT